MASDLDAQREPLDIYVVDGEVVVTGRRVAVALTADAAAEAATAIYGSDPNRASPN